LDAHGLARGAEVSGQLTVFLQGILVVFDGLGKVAFAIVACGQSKHGVHVARVPLDDAVVVPYGEVHVTHALVAAAAHVPAGGQRVQGGFGKERISLRVSGLLVAGGRRGAQKAYSPRLNVVRGDLQQALVVLDCQVVSAVLDPRGGPYVVRSHIGWVRRQLHGRKSEQRQGRVYVRATSEGTQG
jgi:hypothetical protein